MDEIPPSSSSSSSPPIPPTNINLPPPSSAHNLFSRAIDASPGPITLLSTFFSDNDPEYDSRSFSQLLAGAMTSPASVSGYAPSFPVAAELNGGGSDVDFNRPAGLMVSQPPIFTVPPGLSPASLFGSPGFISAGQGVLGMSHQQVLAQFTAQASQAPPLMHVQSEYPPSLAVLQSISFPQLSSFPSNTGVNQPMSSSVPEPNVVKESSELSLSGQTYQPSFAIDKPADDGYNWRKYGQKLVKGSEYPRSYYKCTHMDCPVRKKVERSFDGQVSEIIYKGHHNHPQPQSNKCAKESGNEISNQRQYSESLSGYGVTASSLSLKDQESSHATPEHLSGSSDGEEVGDAETRVGERNGDEPEPKKRNTEGRVSELVSSHRGLTEPRIIVQTTSEVDLLDDGYRWRKYGQKVVKGNPYPRSYYKCTSPGCNVRKHVERAASDPKDVITTYEGKHIHDIPVAKNSSHNMSSNTAPNSKPLSVADDKHGVIRRPENRDQQPTALLQFKEEHIT